MATEKQLLKIEKIQKDMNRARANKKDIAKELSRGRVGYEKAIRSMMTVGSWAAIVPILVAAAAILRFVIPFLNISKYTPEDYQIILLVIYLVACGTSSVLGYKLWNLDVTPFFALISLIVILACNLCLFMGVLPIVTAILAVVALVRWGTFCNWFNGVKRR